MIDLGPFFCPNCQNTSSDDGFCNFRVFIPEKRVYWTERTGWIFKHDTLQTYTIDEHHYIIFARVCTNCRMTYLQARKPEEITTTNTP